MLNGDDKWKSMVIYNEDPKAFSASERTQDVPTNLIGAAPVSALNKETLTFSALRSLKVPKAAAAALTNAVGKVAKLIDKIGGADQANGKSIESHAREGQQPRPFRQAAHSAMRYSGKPIIFRSGKPGAGRRLRDHIELQCHAGECGAVSGAG